MQYAHRNGESEPPTEPGRYWFRGMFGRHECEDMVEVGTDRADWWVGNFALKEANGQWYGPVTPPWEANMNNPTPQGGEPVWTQQRIVDWLDDHWLGVGSAEAIAAEIIEEYEAKLAQQAARIAELEQERNHFVNEWNRLRDELQSLNETRGLASAEWGVIDELVEQRGDDDE